MREECYRTFMIASIFREVKVSRPLFRTGLLSVALSLGACGTAGSPGFISRAPPPPAMVIVTDAGIANLSKDTKYTDAGLRDAFPGYEIETIRIAHETGTAWVHAAFLNGLQVVQIVKGSNRQIKAAYGVGDIVAGPNGERMGQSFSQLGLNRDNCRVGKSLWRGMAICDAKNATKVKLVLSIAGYQGPFDKLANQQDLAAATLQRIIWVPTS